MRVKGKARYGITLLYRHGSYTLRISNLTEKEARETIQDLGIPDGICLSIENKDSNATDTREEAKELVNKLRIELGFRPLDFTRERKPKKLTTYDLEIKLIRKALKRLAPTLKVRRGKGTAYSWIEVKGSKEFGEFTEQEKKALEELGLNYGGNCALISPENRRFYVERASKILNFMPNELKREYTERDNYRKKLEKYRKEQKRRIIEQKTKTMIKRETEHLTYIV